MLLYLYLPEISEDKLTDESNTVYVMYHRIVWKVCECALIRVAYMVKTAV